MALLTCTNEWYTNQTQNKNSRFLSCNPNSTQYIKKRKHQEAASKSEYYLPQPVLLVLKDDFLSFEYSL